MAIGSVTPRADTLGSQLSSQQNNLAKPTG